MVKLVLVVLVVEEELETGGWSWAAGWVGWSPSITDSGGSTERTAVQGSAMALGRARRQLAHTRLLRRVGISTGLEDVGHG